MKGNTARADQLDMALADQDSDTDRADLPNRAVAVPFSAALMDRCRIDSAEDQNHIGPANPLGYGTGSCVGMVEVKQLCLVDRIWIDLVEHTGIGHVVGASRPADRR